MPEMISFIFNSEANYDFRFSFVMLLRQSNPNVTKSLGCTVTFAAGDLCMTVVRALMVATARESSRP